MDHSVPMSQVEGPDEVKDQPPIGDTIGDNPDEAAAQIAKEKEEEERKKREEERKELEAIVEKNMQKYSDAMENTLQEIMTGKKPKKEGAK